MTADRKPADPSAPPADRAENPLGWTWAPERFGAKLRGPDDPLPRFPPKWLIRLLGYTDGTRRDDAA